MTPRDVVVVVLGLAIAVLPIACRADRSDVLLEFEGHVVPRTDFDSHIRDLEARSGPVAPEVRATLLRSFLEERILVLEARREGLIRPEATRDEQDVAVETMMARQTAVLDVTDAEIGAFYTSHRHALREPPTVTLRQILVRKDREALELRQRLGKSASSFEALARSRSIAPEASKGGLMGTFRQGELPRELEAAAWALPVGGLSGVVSSPLGFHILRLEARQDGRMPSLDELRPAIRVRLLSEKGEGKMREFVDGLLARAKVNE